MKTLTNKEKKIISLLYGLNNNEKHSLTEASNEMNISRERIRQIKNIALLKMKNKHSRQEKYLKYL